MDDLYWKFLKIEMYTIKYFSLGFKQVYILITKYHIFNMFPGCYSKNIILITFNFHKKCLHYVYI